MERRQQRSTRKESSAASDVYKRQIPMYVIGKICNIDSEKEEKNRLLDKAQRDSLTNIYNAASVSYTHLTLPTTPYV
ncbi:hypothetical protein CDFC105_30619 [Clostridioides difficile]|nr:hypothetical protein CDFC105_30619 [Clostridioides difficile]